MTNLKPWYNMFPHSNYSQFNLDWLISKYGEYDQRIKTVEEAVADHEERLQTAEADIDSLEGRMDSAEDRLTSAEARITSAEGRITVNEDNITTIFGKLDTDESDISNLKGRMTSAETSITDLSGRMTAAEGDIDTLQSDVIRIDQKDQSQDNDIAGLDSRVTALEEEDAVIANPGGTGPLLNTVGISGVTYTINNSGGGGGGSSVTPNPAGTPTATLNSVDIDGTIYDMPVDASDIADINSDISALDTRVETLEDTVGDTGTRSHVAHSESVFNSSTVQVIPDTQFVIPDGVIALCCASISIDTTNFGSTPRYLGFYIREQETVEPATWTNAALAKFIVNGNEPSMITEAANMNLTEVLTAGTYQLAVRVNSNTPTPRAFHYSASADIVTLRNVGT